MTFRVKRELDIIKRLSGLQDCAYKKLAALDNAIIGVKEVGEDPIEVATYYKDSVITAMTDLRAVGCQRWKRWSLQITGRIRATAI